jgi:hypothetical protein
VSKTRDAIVAKVQDVFVAAGRNCYARELATCIDHFMQLPALRLAEKAEEDRDYRLAVVDTHPSQALWQHPDYHRVIAVAPSTTEVRP